MCECVCECVCVSVCECVNVCVYIRRMNVVEKIYKCSVLSITQNINFDDYSKHIFFLL